MTIKKLELSAKAATKSANEWLASNDYVDAKACCDYVEGWLLRTLAEAAFEEKADEAMRIILDATGAKAYKAFADEIEKVRG